MPTFTIMGSGIGYIGGNYKNDVPYLAAKKAGKNIKGKDYDHKDRKFKSVKKNRGNDGKGTKREGKARY